MVVKAGDVLIVSAGESLLGLHHLDGIGHARSEAVFRPSKALIGERDVLLRHFDLLFRSIQVEKCSAHVVINPTANVLRFGPALSQLSFGLRDIAFDPATGEDGNVDACLKIKIPVRLSEGWPDIAISPICCDYWKAFAFNSRKRLAGSLL
jgi:hypothetical protein